MALLSYTGRIQALILRDTQTPVQNEAPNTDMRVPNSSLISTITVAAR